MTKRKGTKGRASVDDRLWLADWQAQLLRDKLPTSWPAVVGGVPETGECGCCWYRHYSLRHVSEKGGYWMCDHCHPPVAA